MMDIKTGVLHFRKIAGYGEPGVGMAAFFMKADNRFYGRGNGGVEFRMDNTQMRDFSYTGELAVGPGVFRVPILFPITIEAVAVTINTAPTGAAVIVDVNKNGTTIFGTQTARPTIAVGTNLAVVGTPTVTTATVNDWLTVDIDQIGSTVKGSNLVVAISMSRTG